jgi:hypothetical protein
VQPLEKTLRSLLADTVAKARDTAEAGARAALEHLAVHLTAPSPHLTEAQKLLRKRLRIHGKSLDAGQDMDLLVEETAYEHWHRMLFARFLAENGLLMYPDPDGPIPVTLEECQELAEKEGAVDGWELAARYAARMLPQIFRLESPVFSLSLPPEHQQALTDLVTRLPVEVFTASDSLGWVYQYWQARQKDAVNASEVKIGARELPAVTQLFTEPYMVSFLLDNSLGAWWAGRRLSAEMLRTASTEQELREMAALPGVPLQYLRFVREGDSWSPAAGTFARWPQHLSELRSIDPCCGSGHFLAAAFQMLVPLRMEMEGLSARDAVDRVLTENIHGLDIDRRVTEIAAFSLAMAAWRYPGAGGFRQLAPLNVACSGLALNAAREDWEAMAGVDKNLRIALGWVHDTFKDAPVLGSLINPRKTKATELVEWERLSEAIEKALSREQTEEQHEAAIAAQGIARAAAMLGGQYHWVITNVPYLARGNQCERLQEFCKDTCPTGKSDLATVFLDRCMDLCVEGGTTSIVLPQNWLFLTSYKGFREKQLKSNTWHLLTRLGPGAFETISGEVVKAILLTIGRGLSANIDAGLFGADVESSLIHGMDVSAIRSTAEKNLALIVNPVETVKQAQQLGNPDARIILDEEESSSLLVKYAHGVHGFGSKDSPRFFHQFWELLTHTPDWQFMSTTVPETMLYAGREQAVFWQQGKGLLAELGRMGLAIPAGEMAWGKSGIAVSQTGTLQATLHTGDIFDKNVAVVLPRDPSHLPAIWCFCSSPEYHEVVRQIDQSLKVTNATLVKVPFDLEHWTKVAQEKYPNGLPKPYSDDPTQWIFHGNPARSEQPLQVAVARLLGYRWPAELDTEMELSEEARAWVERSAALEEFADRDGIVCIPSVRGEKPAADRLLKLLVAAYNDAPDARWADDTLAGLLSDVGFADRTLERWLRDGFFSQHCKLFKHRPFIWQVWDGVRDGFSALLNYHKLDAKLLETLIFTYLGDWIGRQKQEVEATVDGAQERLDAAQALKSRLELIMKGEAPHDIFVRWKPLAEQPIGWNPDWNDGVRLNIRPFMTVADVSRKGAGVLRDKPNIDWGKDRGKDVETAPWFTVFKGERLNDHHLTLAEKLKARKK